MVSVTEKTIDEVGVIARFLNAALMSDWSLVAAITEGEFLKLSQFLSYMRRQWGPLLGGDKASTLSNAWSKLCGNTVAYFSLLLVPEVVFTRDGPTMRQISPFSRTCIETGSSLYGILRISFVDVDFIEPVVLCSTLTSVKLCCHQHQQHAEVPQGKNCTVWCYCSFSPMSMNLLKPMHIAHCISPVLVVVTLLCMTFLALRFSSILQINL